MSIKELNAEAEGLPLDERRQLTAVLVSQRHKELSDHLFWDVDRVGIDRETHAAWLTGRVLEYGRWADWNILVAEYGKPRLATLATRLRSLSPRSLAFCCAWFQLPKSSFRCSTSMPSRTP